MNNLLIAKELALIAKDLLATGNDDYKHDPEHKHKPHGGGWEKTEKGWTKHKKEKNDGKEKHTTQRNHPRHSYKPTDDFRRIQKLCSEISAEDSAQYHSGCRKIDERIRERLSLRIQSQLRSTGCCNRNRVQSLVNPKSNSIVKIHNDVPGELFHDIFECCHKFLPKGDCVDLHGKEDYNNNKNYILEDGLAGFSITQDGDLVSVFSLSNQRGFLDTIAPIVKKNCKSLDCFKIASTQKGLPELYAEKFGFKTSSILDFNQDVLKEDKGKEYADYFVKNYGEAPVHFMVNSEEDIEIKHFNKDQYDEAKSYQQQTIMNSGKSIRKSSIQVNRKYVARELILTAKGLLADNKSEYKHDPEHKHKPQGGGWEKTEKGWTKNKKEKKETNVPKNPAPSVKNDLAEKCKNFDRYDLGDLLHNPDLPQESFMDLYKGIKKLRHIGLREYALEELAGDPRLPDDVKIEMSKSTMVHAGIIRKLLESPNLPKQFIENVYNGRVCTVELAKHPSTPPEILHDMHCHFRLRWENYGATGLASNPNLWEETIKLMADDVLKRKPYRYERMDGGQNQLLVNFKKALINNPKLPKEYLKKFAEDENDISGTCVEEAKKKLEELSKGEQLGDLDDSIDLSKLSPETREQVRDMTPEELRKFIGWLKKRKDA